MSIIEFQPGGQIELTVLGVRVGDLRQLADRYGPGDLGNIGKAAGD